MAEHSFSIEEAQTDLLACAVYVAENIGSREARTAALETIISYFLNKSDVDNAAGLADSIDDPFTRDRLLASVVSKCAETDDDDYALQLIDAIVEHSAKNTARENFALAKARKGQFDVALDAARSLDHSSDALAGIAVFQIESGFEAEAYKTLEKIDFYSAKVDALQSIANHYLGEDETERALAALDRAASDAQEIEFTEDRIRSMLGIGATYIEAGLNDKAIEIYGKTSEIIAGLDGVHKDNLFVNTAVGFLRAGSIDLADRTLDLVVDKAQIADCLVGFSQIFRIRGELEDALESLEEAYAILRSQSEREIRDTKSRLQLFAAIAKEFAALGKTERGLEIAHDSPDEQLKNVTLSQIATICTLAGNHEMAGQAILGIGDDSQRIPALIAKSDALAENGSRDDSLESLEEARRITDSIPQFIMRSELMNEIAKRYHRQGLEKKARQIASDTIEVIQEIRGDANRAAALAELSQTFVYLDLELSGENKRKLATFVRSSDW